MQSTKTPLSLIADELQWTQAETLAAWLCPWTAPHLHMRYNSIVNYLNSRFPLLARTVKMVPRVSKKNKVHVRLFYFGLFTECDDSEDQIPKLELLERQIDIALNPSKYAYLPFPKVEGNAHIYRRATHMLRKHHLKGMDISYRKRKVEFRFMDTYFCLKDLGDKYFNGVTLDNFQDWLCRFGNLPSSEATFNIYDRCQVKIIDDWVACDASVTPIKYFDLRDRIRALSILPLPIFEEIAEHI